MNETLWPGPPQRMILELIDGNASRRAISWINTARNVTPGGICAQFLYLRHSVPYIIRPVRCVRFDPNERDLSVRPQMSCACLELQRGFDLSREPRKHERRREF